MRNKSLCIRWHCPVGTFRRGWPISDLISYLKYTDCTSRCGWLSWISLPLSPGLPKIISRRRLNCNVGFPHCRGSIPNRVIIVRWLGSIEWGPFLPLQTGVSWNNLIEVERRVVGRACRSCLKLLACLFPIISCWCRSWCWLHLCTRRHPKGSCLRGRCRMSVCRWPNILYFLGGDSSLRIAWSSGKGTHYCD